MATKISPAELNTLLSCKKVLLVDVREPGEYQREHIEGAKLYPMSSFNPEQVLQDAARGTVPLCVQCLSGGRSGKAATALAQFIEKAGGSTGPFASVKLLDLNGGISAWTSAGLPIVEDKKAPLPIIRQVHLIASTLIITGSLLTRFCHPNFFVMPLFVGCGLFLSGATGFCGMAMLLRYLPYNRNCYCSAEVKKA